MRELNGKELMVWDDKKNLLHLDADWEFKISLMLRDTIHHNSRIMTEEMHNEIQQKIYDIYVRNFNFYDGIPDFEDIFTDVESYNHDILKKISEIHYDMEGYLEDLTLDHEDATYELQRSYEEVNNYDFWDHLQDFVYATLVELDLSFYLPDSYISTRLLGSEDVMVVVNDCQEVLFPEFIEVQNEVLSFYEDMSKLRIIGR
jgi:hypothetical protein